MSARLKDMFNRKSVKRVLIGISAIALTACVLIMLPAVERLVIRFVEENLLHRTLGNPEYWLNYLFSTGYVFFMPAALLLIFLLAGKNPGGCLCLLIICFVLNMFLYKLFSAGRGAHDRLRFPLFVLLLAVIIHIVRNHGLFNQITDRLTKICGKITKSKIITGDVFVFICGGLIGAVFFIFVFGTIILDFTYTDWLMAGGDLSQHYLGWRLFRSSSWYFPFGLMDNIVYPFKESIIYTDSIPLFAVIFKMFSPVLPENFQYFGLFGIICYTLQGGIGAMLIRRIGGGAAHAIIGSVFFVLSTVMMQRIYGHTSLSAHFIILLMILACLKKPGGACKKDVLVWSGLICLAAMIHIYFVPMVIIFMCFYILRNCLILKNPGSQLLIAGIPAAMLFIVLFWRFLFSCRCVGYRFRRGQCQS
ncbi:MAG: DUF6311 domain-containing protein [Treponema sp.]|jgi:hypothetical protein|nr:DUF6311 domain-containing protein [Treponema sp.]